MTRAILLGDSIFDNGAYVQGGSPLVEQLQSRLPDNWKVALLAQDGAIVEDVLEQLQNLPADATHLIVSAGGNDALQCSPIINSPAEQSTAMLEELVAAVTEFRSSYSKMVRAIVKQGLPAIGCTIYDGVPGLGPREIMALSLFNDIIVRELAASQIPILDLRRICTESRDYSAVSPIEPSEVGGSKIARALQRFLLGYDFNRHEAVIFA